MIAFRGKEEEQKVAALAKLMHLDKSEVLRRAVNSYYEQFQEEFQAYWLEERLDKLPGSGRKDVSERRKELLDEIYADRTGHR